ncbi:MAG: hypothetical protein AAGF11_55320 [Myxococcota bacterium]
MRHTPAWLAATCALLIAACAAPNLSRTVGQGNGEVRATLGGPLIGALGPTIPFPHVQVGGRVGATDWLDVDGNLNLLGLAFGIWAMDLAANLQLYRKARGLAVATSGRLYLLGDLDDAPLVRVYPEWGLHLGGPIPGVDWLALYGGQTLTISPSPPRDGSAVFFTPFLGVEALLPYRRPRRGKPRQHAIAMHTSWTNPWDDTVSVLDYRPDRGALGIYLGYRLRLGGLNR